jgi:hypothetical protein
MKAVLTPSLIALLLAASGIPRVAVGAEVFIGVPAIIELELEPGSAGALPIEIDQNAGLTGPAMILIRGLPSTVSLDGARLFPSGVWVIKPAALKQVQVRTTSATIERVTVGISLVGLDGSLLGRAATQLIVGPKQKDAQSNIATSKEDDGDVRNMLSATNPLAVSQTEALSEDENAALLEQATGMLKSGDFEAARLIYVELAAHGSGRAAFLLAQSYDPEVLQAHFLVGMKPDSAKARQWYFRAAELGDREAQRHLSIVGRVGN